MRQLEILEHCGHDVKRLLEYSARNLERNRDVGLFNVQTNKPRENSYCITSAFRPDSNQTRAISLDRN